MEGDLQPLFLLLTDYYIYLLRKGKSVNLDLMKQTISVQSDKVVYMGFIV